MTRYCAICDGTNLHTRLCAACRADPANADWIETDTATPSDAIDAMAPACNLAELQIKPLPPVSDTTRRVLLLVITGRVTERVRNRGANRAAEPWAWRERAMHFTEIAQHLGCSKQLVSKIVRKNLKRQ